jgi:hypothetical protein
MLKNKKGGAAILPIIIFVSVVIGTHLMTETSFEDGKMIVDGDKAMSSLEKNGKIIWCKMQGKTDCDTP